ncbi:autotransporter outer membrane beta-barrel domain-containing protein [Haematospirillum sp. H1815]|uniref:autotransporter outer membrane beta-barrel domain-containing protein n=1 Tax=Haematospirillum sp. H1815 TaxID=2723108 RepID=UPI001439184B|nr:autotransporter outer membrane beta-barrel domain-containing protein [Haematospirillum sp. H1815]NKD77654.1 autotransporter outer membrane beta-barrel domain-containing protein [Haematospirillum sp. H1815]
MLQKRKHLLATTALAAVVMAIPGVAGATSSAAPAQAEVVVQNGGYAAEGKVGNGGGVIVNGIAANPQGLIKASDIAADGKYHALNAILATSLATDAAATPAKLVEQISEIAGAGVTDALINALRTELVKETPNFATISSAAKALFGSTKIDASKLASGFNDLANYFTNNDAGKEKAQALLDAWDLGQKLLTQAKRHDNIVASIGTADKPEPFAVLNADKANVTVDETYTDVLTMNAGKTFTAQSGRTEAKAVVINGEGSHVIGKSSAGAVGGFDLGNVSTTKNGQGKLELHAAADTVDGDGKVTKKGGTVGNIGTPGKRFADVTINATESKAVATGGDVHADKLTLKTVTARAADAGNAINLGYVGTGTLVLDGPGTNSIGGSAKNVQGFNIGKVETKTHEQGVLRLYAAEGSRIGQIGTKNHALNELRLEKGSLALGSGEVHAKNLHLENGTNLRLDGLVKLNGTLHAPEMKDETKRIGTLKDGSEYSYWGAKIIVTQKAIDAAMKANKAVLEVESIGGFTSDSATKKVSAIIPSVENTVLEGKFKSFKINTPPAALSANDKMFVEEVFGRDYGTALARIESIVSDDRTLTTTTVSPRSDSEIARRLSVSTDEAKAIKAVVRSLGGDAEARAAMNVALGKNSDAGNAARQSAVSTVSQANQAINTASRAAADAVASRLASARTGTDVAGLQQSGTAAGDSTLRNGAWVKAAGSTASQKSRGGVAGNSTNSYGMTIGVDNTVADDLRVGLALSTSKSDMKGKGASQTKTDVTSYQVALYGSYEPEGFFVEGQLAYAQNSVKTSRQISIGGLDRTAKGKYDANQYSASVAAGSPLHRGAVTLTPKAGLSYTYTDPSKYTETGAGAFNMTVDPSATSILEGSLGGSLAYEHQTLRGSVVRPEMRAAALYDFIGDDATSTGKYSGDATLFNTSGLKRSRFGGTIGAGLGYTTADGVWEVRADYDAEMRSGYVGHNGMLTGRVNF